MFSGHRRSVFVAIALALSLAATPLVQAAQTTATVPRDTVVKLILNNRLSTKDTNVGDKFTATVAEDIVVDGRTVIRHGAVVDGTVTQVERPKRLAGLNGQAKLMLRFDRIHANGNRQLAATLLSVHDPVSGVKVEDDDQEDQGSKVGDEGEVKTRTDTRDILTKGAIGVAAGAVLGALFGNVSRGVLLGTIGGAVAILAPKGKDIKLEKGTGLRIRLDRDLNVGIT